MYLGTQNSLGVFTCLHRLRYLGGNQCLEWGGLDLDSLLSKSVEEFAPRCGLAAVEPKCELIEVVLQMLMSDGALVGAQQPPFE